MAGIDKTIASLGPVMQLAFVPTDFDAAIKHWTTVMGVGPFFLMENIRLDDMKCMGEPTDAVFTLALAYWGDMQIELIRPENDAPSHLSGEYGVRDRLHHTCLLLDDIQDAYAACEKHGAKILVEGRVGDEGAVIYADPGGGPGHVVEMLQTQPGTHELFAMIKQAGVDWDGSDPVRKLG